MMLNTEMSEEQFSQRSMLILFSLVPHHVYRYAAQSDSHQQCTEAKYITRPMVVQRAIRRVCLSRRKMLNLCVRTDAAPDYQNHLPVVMFTRNDVIDAAPSLSFTCDCVGRQTVRITSC